MVIHSFGSRSGIDSEAAVVGKVLRRVFLEEERAANGAREGG